MKFSLAYFTSGGMELNTLGISVRSLEKKGVCVDVFARNSTQLLDRRMAEEAIQKALSSHAVVVNLHGSKSSCPIFDELIGAIRGCPQKRRPYLHIDPTQGDEDSMEAAKEFSPDYGNSRWHTIHQYLVHGGAQNMANLILYLAQALGLDMAGPAPPSPVPTEGIYHPDIPGIPPLEAYLAQKVLPGRPTLGVWFYQTYWLNRNLQFIDALVREVEAQGANVIPVFHQRFKDIERGNLGADQVVEKYFMSGDGRPRIDGLINPMMFCLKMAGDTYQGLLERLDVPVIQAMVSLGARRAWEENPHGLTFMDVTYNAAQPEMDGVLITIPVATREVGGIDPVTGAEIVQYLPVEERLSKVVRIALRWANLRRKPNREKRIAIVFHHYPPRDDRVGCAVGLDSFASVKKLLDAMKAEGYLVEETYGSGDALKERLFEGITPDVRWGETAKMATRARVSCPSSAYAKWFKTLPLSVQDEVVRAWGEPPGTHMVHADKVLLPGLVNGNVFITVQPSRGSIEKAREHCHDPWLPPPHSYLAHYWWISHVFRADAIIHVGKHGTLEWLPGKSLGLSNRCYPDIAMDDMPNIYPYIINDPSEGTQAKRRSYACIVDHLTPAFTNADLHDELARIDNLLTEYAHMMQEDPEKAQVLKTMIWEAVEEAGLHHDLKTNRQGAMADFEAFLERLHHHLLEISDTMIADGLHVLGDVPEGERLVEFVVQLTRLDVGEIPSLRTTCAMELGYSREFLTGNEETGSARERRNAIERAHEKAISVVEDLILSGANRQAVSTVLHRHFSEDTRTQAQKALLFVVEELLPAIRRTTDEIDACLKALSGRFVPPGPSGAPTRGQADILPTGRNFYSVDPTKIPTRAAWERGKRMGEALIERHLEEHGTYPATIGIVVYGGPTMRTRGEDVAEILWLMGVRPMWHRTSEKVLGVEIIPSSELGRPRLDVVPRVSGFFRDAFPNLIELIDEAASMVAALNELPHQNILRKNALIDAEDYMEAGLSEDEAWRRATLRVFGCPPGTYGAGVAELVESKQWKDRGDLAKAYIRYSSHAYGKGTYGERQTDAFERVLSRMDVTVKNEDSREYDMMSCTDYFNYYGGLIAAAGSVRGQMPASYMGDSQDPHNPRVRSTREEAVHVLRARLTNPKWIKGMMRHGYKGAGDISHMMDVVFGWDATADVIEDWMYEKIASSYCLDQQVRQWMKEVNPHALYNILDKLMEAISRGMWNPDKESAARLRDMYLEMEGEMEERSA